MEYSFRAGDSARKSVIRGWSPDRLPAISGDSLDPQQVLESCMSAFDIATHHRTRLLEVGPGLPEAIPRDDRVAARRLIVSEARRAERGPWSPDLSCRDG